MYSYPSNSWPSCGLPYGIWSPTDSIFVPSSGSAVWSCWPALSPAPAVLDAGEHGVPNDGMSDASEAFGRLLCRAFATNGAWLRIPRGLYRFDAEIEVLAFGVDEAGERVMDFSTPLSNAEMRELGGIVPDHAPPHERPWSGPHSRSKLPLLSPWTNDDGSYGIAGDGMSDDADAFGLLLLGAAEGCPRFAIEIPRGMYRFDSEIVLRIPAPEPPLSVRASPRFASGDRIPVRDPAEPAQVFWITLP